jgi:hypothetical protein
LRTSNIIKEFGEQSEFPWTESSVFDSRLLFHTGSWTHSGF